jgi:hypothetical protein
MISRLLILLCVCFLLYSCGKTTSVKEKRMADSLARIDSIARIDSLAQAAIEASRDLELDYTGRFLAGFNQTSSNAFSKLEDDKFWQEYKLMMDSSWTRMTRDRLNKMRDWEESHLGNQINDTLPLFYPFSGPDFLHANLIYPKTKTFVLAALEPIIELPHMSELSLKERDVYLDTLANSLRDIFQKSYFITTHMTSDFKKVKGVLPLLYVFMERSGYELLTSKFIYIDSTGVEKEVDAKKQHWKKTPGVKITFRDRTTKEVKTLYYFSISISNQGLQERPEFDKFIKSFGPVNVFVKSASYLMHISLFTDIKKLIFSQANSIFQDDTGIPYRDFKRKKDWSVTLYGEYVKPISDFVADTYQADLDSAYKKIKTEVLPFSLGYHWRNQKQNYLLIKKNK